MSKIRCCTGREQALIMYLQTVDQVAGRVDAVVLHVNDAQRRGLPIQRQIESQTRAGFGACPSSAPVLEVTPYTVAVLGSK